MVLTIVQRQLVFFSFEGKFSLPDPISVSPDDRAEIGCPLDISLNGIISQHNVCQRAFPIFGVQARNDGSVGNDINPHPGVVFE